MEKRDWGKQKKIDRKFQPRNPDDNSEDLKSKKTLRTEPTLNVVNEDEYTENAKLVNKKRE